MSDKTTIGDRMKSYETPTTSRKAYKGQPLIVRLDGKNFHSFTKGLKRPYDERLSALMCQVTKELVDVFNAKIGYTQSDEIQLAWYHAPHETPEYPFAGRLQKIESLLAAYCSVTFCRLLGIHLPEKEGKLAIFDARAFVVPTLTEAYNAFLWRQQDCTKNAISMAAQSMFSHSSLQGLHGPQMQEKMWAEKGVNFDHYPAFFKRGTFYRREKVMRVLTDAELAVIPEQHRPTGPVERTQVRSMDVWLAKEQHPVSVLFDNADPVVIRVVSAEEALEH